LQLALQSPQQYFRRPGKDFTRTRILRLLGEEFGWHGNQHNRVPSARLLAHSDLLNQIVTAVQFHTRHVAEIVVAQRSIAEIPF
jgi:hypothetical protein